MEFPRAVDVGLVFIRMTGKRPNREAVIQGHFDYELWVEADGGPAVIIDDGLFRFARTIQSPWER